MDVVQTPTTSGPTKELKDTVVTSTGNCCEECGEEKLEEDEKGRRLTEVETDVDKEKVEEDEFLNRPYRSRGSRKLLEKSFRPLRQLVSQNRRRFREDGFDLDLTYITDRIIAMGYPSGGHEWFYRNPMSATVAFLENRHKDHYMVFNFIVGGEQLFCFMTNFFRRGYYNYDTRNFDNRVLYFEMNDHHPPRLEQISRICRRAHEYLLEDLRNVIVFHCKAGKGRTGVMICAYLIYINFYFSPRQVLDYYGIVRTVNNKGVTIPSQRRYVYYFSQMRKNHLNYIPLRMELKGIYWEHPPTKKSAYKKYSYLVKLSIGDVEVYAAPPFSVDGTEEDNVWAQASSFGEDTFDITSPKVSSEVVSRRCYGWTLDSDRKIFVEGDVKISMFRKKVYLNKRLDNFGKEKIKEIGHVWFNTMFACPAFCGGIYIHGDQQLPYPLGGTTLLTNINGGSNLNSDKNEEGFKQFKQRKGGLNDTKRSQLRIEDIIVPPGLAEHCPLDSLNLIYTSHNLRPPREKIMELLLEAHNNGLVSDCYNEKKKKNYSSQPIAKAIEGKFNGDGPWLLKREPNDHVLVFDRLEIDKACKNERLDLQMKLIVVLKCLDENEKDKCEAARKFMLDVTTEQQRFNDKRRQKMVLDSYVERHGKFSRKPNYGIDEFGNEVLTGSVVSTQPFRGDVRLVDYELRRKYFGRQRSDSVSVYPPIHHKCPLLVTEHGSAEKCETSTESV